MAGLGNSVQRRESQFRRLNERATPDAGGVWIPRAPPGLSRWVKKMREKMPAISHLFFTHAARAWGSSPELGESKVLQLPGENGIISAD